MAVNHTLTLRYYLRMLAWAFILYVLWCFAPTLYGDVHFRMDVYSAVAEGASSGSTPDQIREAILFKAGVLKLPIKPEDIEVTTDGFHTIRAHYSYGTVVTCFRQVVPLDFHGSTSADSIVSFNKSNPTGN